MLEKESKTIKRPTVKEEKMDVLPQIMIQKKKFTFNFLYIFLHHNLRPYKEHNLLKIKLPLKHPQIFYSAIILQ